MIPLVQRRAVLLRDSINQTLDILTIRDVGIMARRLHWLLVVLDKILSLITNRLLQRIFL